MPELSNILIGPPSVLTSFNLLPVLADINDGSPDTLLAPTKGLLLASLVPLKIFIATPQNLIWNL